MTYNPETYWSREAYGSRVGQEIEKRAGDNVVIARRRQSLLQLQTIKISVPVSGYHRLPVKDNHGGRLRSGGNLRHIATFHRPKLILGADISQTMCDIARNLRSFRNVRLTKIDGTHLPFEDRSIDSSFTVTVLQHITDAAMLEALVKDICRVTRDTVLYGPRSSRRLRLPVSYL